MALPSGTVSSEEISSNLPVPGTMEYHLLNIVKAIQIDAGIANILRMLRNSNSEDIHPFANLESQVNSLENLFTPTLKSETIARGSNGSTESESPINANETEAIPQETQPNSSCESEAKLEKPHPSSEEKCLPEGEFATEVSIERGKALLVHLIQNFEQQESIRIETSNALKASSKPGKLVIEALRWFYPTETNDGCMDYELYVIRRSCMLLLEEMNHLRMLIEPQEQDEAKALALIWMARLKAGVTNSQETFGYLLLMGAFGLKDCFDKDDILNLFSAVAKHKKATQYFRCIGLEGRAPEFIEKLISQKKGFDAVRFIYDFGLTDKFSSVSILKDHLMELKMNVEKISDEGRNSQLAKEIAVKREISAIKDVYRFIVKYKLESQYSPGDLKDRIVHLRNQVSKQTEKKADAIVPSPKDEKKQQSGNKQAAPAKKPKRNKRKKQKEDEKEQQSGNKQAAPAKKPKRNKKQKASGGGSSKEDAPSFSVNQASAPSSSVKQASAPSSFVNQASAPSSLVNQVSARSSSVKQASARSSSVKQATAPSSSVNQASAPSSFVNQASAPSSFVNQASAPHLMQPPHHQRGIYSSQETQCFPPTRSYMQSSASQYTHAMQSYDSQPVSSFSDHGVHFSTGISGRYGRAHSTTDVRHTISLVRAFGKATSPHAAQNINLAARHYGLNSGLSFGQHQEGSSDYITPRMHCYNERTGSPFARGYGWTSQHPPHH